ncbi:thiamine phosphate synthase [Desulfotalea psychrophila]|uniref:Thiamine-phosphate synthase n=1 Tax=Desulfotalea psychrophila (strain LSv54 / DSM 12343) TaxID=177439 RepID=Q6APA6_DESPS|nr:thiamine phosphate synthase [Desulfotalea psychrophila]CAG35818.1 probable thiamine phosphate pyrophosphorylase (ThiE) [Desulfotalea psychrophila LSv54]
MVKDGKSRQADLYGWRRKVLMDEVTVYPVCCEQLSAGRSDKEWLDNVLAGGAKIVQLRDKKSDDRLLLEKAKYFREKTREAGALFLINDRFDIGLLADSDGIHVGQGDLPPEEIRRLTPDWIIGQSCNDLAEVEALGAQVQAGSSAVDYYNIGPIYRTDTKEGLHTFLGAGDIQQISAACPLPFTVMGGIKWDHIPELAAAGVRRMAVVTAISMAADMQAETRRWIDEIRRVTTLPVNSL